MANMPEAPAQPVVQPPDPMPTLDVGRGSVVSAVVALLVAMGEISRLSGEVLDDTGRSWAFGTLMGFGRLLSPATEGWSAVFTSDGGDRGLWLVGYLVLDAVLIWLYGVVIAGWLSSWWPTMAKVLRSLAIIDVIEDVLALLAGTVFPPAPTILGVGVGVATMVKCVLMLVVVVLLAHRLATPAGWASIRVWRLALYHQRFSILAVLPIAVLSIPGGSDLLDQLPDVQRRWLRDGQGALHAAFAVLVVAVVAGGVLLLGRLRSGALWHRTEESVVAEQPAVLRLGLVAAAVVVVALVWIWVRGGGPPWQMPGLDPWRTFAFLSVPVGIIAVSWVVRWRLAVRGEPDGTTTWFRPKYHSVPTEEQKRANVLAGDILAVCAVVVGGLGLVRSFTPIVALESVGLLDWSWPGTAAFIVGLAVSVLAWRWCAALFSLVTDESLQCPDAGEDAVRAWHSQLPWWQRVQVVFTPSSPAPARLGVRVGVLVAGIVIFFVVGSAPDWFGATVGVIGSSLLALLAASLVIGGSVVAVQDRLAPEMFWFKWIRMSSLPITTLLLGILVWTSGMGSNVDIHGVRGLTSTAKPPLDPTTRPTVTGAVGDWVTATAGCGHVVTAGAQQYRLHPMLLLAAEGGGIRAAYWTAASLDLLRGVASAGQTGTVDWAASTPENACARALFAGGASGGAVGLTVSRFAGANSARGRVVAMAGPNALGSATTGLFIRDTAYSATGVPFFGALGSTTGHEWLDRGGLIEKSWEATSGLDVPFLPDDTHSAATAVTGALVLNSTRVADGCRMWVSQLQFGTTGNGGCDSPSTTPSGHTLDLFATVGNAVPGRTVTAQDHCLGPITAATGALLASRFPFVTPSGVIGDCAGQPEQQLVDGGYVENTGLATILALAPTWLQEVQRRNSAALAGTSQVKDLIVPVVMYLDNGTGGDLIKDPPAPTSEVLVPSTTTGRAKTALIDTPALLRDAERIIVTPSLFDAGSGVSADLVTAIDSWRRTPVVVVHQSTFPAVTAPLGWVLSQQSIETMDRALAQQAQASDTAGAAESVSSRGSLADALRLVSPDAK